MPFVLPLASVMEKQWWVKLLMALCEPKWRQQVCSNQLYWQVLASLKKFLIVAVKYVHLLNVNTLIFSTSRVMRWEIWTMHFWIPKYDEMIIWRKNTCVIEILAELDNFSWKIISSLKEWLTEDLWPFRLRSIFSIRINRSVTSRKTTNTFVLPLRSEYLSDRIWKTCVHHRILATFQSLF